MKWFVTDAQLAAMHLEHAARHADAWEREWERLKTLHDAEVRRLRDDRATELARMTDPQGPLVTHYREEVAFWRKQFLAERQRADVALDQCRVTHQGIGPVSLPPREDRLPREMETLFQTNPELAAMGSTDGV